MILREASPADTAAALAIWRSAVDATHGFLAPDDRTAIEAEVAAFLPYAPMTLACADDGTPLGFLIRDGAKVEALFVAAESHGRGVGSALLRHARAAAGEPLAVDANLEADNALPFYRARGFVETGRSDRDGQGRPYPLVHLRQAD